MLKKDVVAGLIMHGGRRPGDLAVGRLADGGPGRLKLVTATIVIIALVALTVAVIRLKQEGEKLSVYGLSSRPSL